MLSPAGGASAAIVGPAADTPKEDTPSRHVITLSEEEIFDVSLATFYVFDKENARTHLAAQSGNGLRQRLPRQRRQGLPSQRRRLRRRRLLSGGIPICG
jgi:hypothetical protein